MYGISFYNSSITAVEAHVLKSIPRRLAIVLNLATSRNLQPTNTRPRPRQQFSRFLARLMEYCYPSGHSKSSRQEGWQCLEHQPAEHSPGLESFVVARKASSASRAD